MGGEDEEEGVTAWLEDVRDEFPQEIITTEEMASWLKGPMEVGIKERLRKGATGVMDAFSPRRQSEKPRTSTPEDKRKRRAASAKKEDGKRGEEETGSGESKGRE